VKQQKLKNQEKETRKTEIFKPPKNHFKSISNKKNFLIFFQEVQKMKTRNKTRNIIPKLSRCTKAKNPKKK
jgi:hypothetical protein